MTKISVIKNVLLINAILFFSGCSLGFGPTNDKAEIPQKIGGMLICNSVYTADIHSWQFDVSYVYKTPAGETFNLGNGSYYGREWNKDEQLIKYNNWIILKTGGWSGTDKVIIGDLQKRKWINYEFTPDSVEKENLWQSKNIHSLLNWCCPETFVDTISNGIIVVHYKFRTDERKVNQYGQKKIVYKINDSTGELSMIKVE